MILMVSCFPTDPKAPDILIINPPYGENYIIGQVITIEVEATDEDGTVEEVVISVDTVELARKTESPYTAVWETAGWAPDTAAGWTKDTLRILVKATDDSGLSFTASNPVYLYEQ